VNQQQPPTVHAYRAQYLMQHGIPLMAINTTPCAQIRLPPGTLPDAANQENFSWLPDAANQEKF
jgi:hypothetical protein